MYTQRDREIILHIRDYFSVDDDCPKYLEDVNTIILEIKGEHITHPFFITCWRNILTVKTIKKIDIKNHSAEFFKYVLELNKGIPFGGFCYEPDCEVFAYKLDTFIFDVPSEKIILALLTSARNVLDIYLPEMFLKAQELALCSKKQENPTYH